MDVRTDIDATVWKIEVAVGDEVVADDVLVILESMKMEVAVTAPASGRVRSLAVEEGSSVKEDDVLLVLDPG